MFQMVFLIIVGLEGLLLVGILISSAHNEADEECGQSRKVYLPFSLGLFCYYLSFTCFFCSDIF